MATCRDSVWVNSNDKDGETDIIRDGKVVCVDLDVVLRKIRDLTDEEKVEEELEEWEW